MMLEWDPGGQPRAQVPGLKGAPLSFPSRTPSA